jgi:sugar phosphate isomerase/epimerase
MIIATSTLPYRNPMNSNFPEQIACAQRDGFGACEMHAPFPGQCPSAGDIDEILKSEMACSVHANYLDNNLASSDRCVRQASVRQIKADILFAGMIQAGLVIVHPGCLDSGGEEEAYGALDQSLEELLSFARGQRVTVTLENMDGSGNKLCSVHRDVGKMIERHPDLKLTLDFAHIGMTHQEILPFLEDFSDRIAHFHISGFMEEKPHPEVSLPESQIDFRPYLQKIRDWDRMITLEISDRLKSIESRGVIEEVFGQASESE